MTLDDVVAGLALPQEARVNRRVPKTLLNEHGAPTTADKNHINEGIEELVWVAALKSSNIGVPPFRDATREYLEIAVLTLALRPGAALPRLAELVHRAIPYPLFLVAGLGGEVSVSLAHKRYSQGETGKTVLDGSLTAVSIPSSSAGRDFLGSIPVAVQPKDSMYALYQAWIATVEACQAAAITGQFVPKPPGQDAEGRRMAIAEHERLQREIAQVRSKAAKEKQMNRRVELNAMLKRLETQLAVNAARL